MQPLFSLLLKNSEENSGCFISTGGNPPAKRYAKYLPTIGILRPMPKAFGETRKIGGVW